MTTSNLYQISYSDLERAGWPMDVIEDYQSFKRNAMPQHGTEADPNGIYKANMNGFYVDTNTAALWFNPIVGAETGWIAL